MAAIGSTPLMHCEETAAIIDSVLVVAHPTLRARCDGDKIVEVLEDLGAYDAGGLRALIRWKFDKVEDRLSKEQAAPATFLALLAATLSESNPDEGSSAGAPTNLSPSPPLEASVLWLHGLHLIDLLKAAMVSRAWQAHARNPALWRHLTLVTGDGARKDAQLSRNLEYRSHGIQLRHCDIGNAEVRRFIDRAQGQLRSVTVSGLAKVTHMAFVGLEQQHHLESVCITYCPRTLQSWRDPRDVVPMYAPSAPEIPRDSVLGRCLRTHSLAPRSRETPPPQAGPTRRLPALAVRGSSCELPPAAQCVWHHPPTRTYGARATTRKSVCAGDGRGRGCLPHVHGHRA
jgi:hypothetical protein